MRAKSKRRNYLISAKKISKFAVMSNSVLRAEMGSS